MIKRVPRFLKMRDYTSRDKTNPDKIIIKVTSFEKFKSEHTINVMAELQTDWGFVPIKFPLRPRRQNTSTLSELWNENVKSKIIKKGKVICLETWKKGVKRFWKLSSLKSLR